jgi:hypothetical protein
MTWIRSPAYDIFWFLSGPVLFVLLVILPLPAILTLNFGHALSPIALAWTHQGFRKMMLRNPAKFIGVPALVMFFGAVAAVTTWTVFPSFRPERMVLENLRFDQLGVPMVIFANIYAVWNLYHAGAQNFGFLCLYRRKSFAAGWERRAVLGVCVLVTAGIGHEVSRVLHVPEISLFLAGFFFVNHWLAAIGLSAHVHGQHTGWSPLWFVGAILAAALVLVLAFDTGLWYSTQLAILALCLRAAFGMWHFLQDRWIWKLSDPRIRVIIGGDIFSPRHSPFRV